jgi:hypothetical protein
MTLPEDALASLCTELRDHDVDAQLRERIRRRAKAVLRQEQRRIAHPLRARVSLWYHRAFEPALLIGLGASYLAWAIRGTLALLH